MFACPATVVEQHHANDLKWTDSQQAITSAICPPQQLDAKVRSHSPPKTNSQNKSNLEE
ncbi:hypothetical protein RISK_000834 [Rhodopirellula islandica]|uniref:Uncharacterized protein n=1 Tax=Rhodopirellula islandica TaxID=595434 RepID=A0A0J1BKS7_RHOIS|nr:hypothetical protein RISK_000834 [Rhodopirellula islandica]